MAIAGCERCPAKLIEHNWLPVGYFGNYTEANAWVVSINPSHREFLDARGQLLRGENTQRFSLLADDPTCETRSTFANRHLSTIIARQDNFYRRNPYRGFFGRLGAFLLQVHQVPDSEPLRPFLEPLPDSSLYCHLDIVKCATTRRWSNLTSADRTLVRRNCQSFLAQQLKFASQLRLILVNGRTAMEGVGEAFTEIGFRIRPQLVSYHGHNATLWIGESPQHPTIRFLGWSANVVNGHMTHAEKKSLAELVRTALARLHEQRLPS